MFLSKSNMPNVLRRCFVVLDDIQKKRAVSFKLKTVEHNYPFLSFRKEVIEKVGERKKKGKISKETRRQTAYRCWQHRFCKVAHDALGAICRWKSPLQDATDSVWRKSKVRSRSSTTAYTYADACACTTELSKPS